MMLFVAQHHHSLPFFVSNHVGHQEGRSEILWYGIIFLHHHRVRYLKKRPMSFSSPGADVRMPDVLDVILTEWHPPTSSNMILPDRRGDHSPWSTAKLVLSQPYLSSLHITHYTFSSIYSWCLQLREILISTKQMACLRGGSNPFKILINLIIPSEISRCYY